MLTNEIFDNSKHPPVYVGLVFVVVNSTVVIVSKEEG